MSIKSISVLDISLIIRNMATPFLAESIRSKRGKDKLVILGFIYTLNKSNDQLNHWVCENRGHCKARISTKIDLTIVKGISTKSLIATPMDRIFHALKCLRATIY